MKKKTINIILGLSVVFNLSNLSFAGSNPVALRSKPDSQTDSIITEILAKKEKYLSILKKNGGSDFNLSIVEFAVFMDFDGTIMYGDMTEGDATAASLYKGLAEQAITQNMLENYKGESGYKKHINTYEKILTDTRDHGAAYNYTADVVTNKLSVSSTDYQTYIRDYFASTLNKYLFTSSVKIMKALDKAGIKIYIISASPLIYAKEANVLFPFIHKDNIFGIDPRVDSSGNKIDPIINFAEGKIERIKSIIKREQDAGKLPILLGGFGNSWSTDGAFLKWLAKTDFTDPKEELGYQILNTNEIKPTVVMINGGPTQEDIYGIKEVNQKAMLGIPLK